MTELIGKGAESEIYKINDTTLKKIRLPKTYRITEIDERLRKFRNRREFKVLTKLYENKILVPKPYKIIEDKRIPELSFEFEYIHGEILKTCLNQELLEKAFNEIIKMHKLGVIHGDLTTLNMINKENNVYLIDFGLAEYTDKSEDKAVDLHLFFNCLKNEHPKYYKEKENFLNIYKKEINESVLKSLYNIEHRGRNKNK